jgi:acetyltransferase-like isoleucine patch superfamily enzyme
MPGVIVRKNTFVQAGTVLTKSTIENSILYGNPQKTKNLN